jgi:signal transduction histidine kinase
VHGQLGRILRSHDLQDLALASALAVFAELELTVGSLSEHLTEPQRSVNAATLPFIALPLAVRRRMPAFAFLAAATATWLQVFAGGSLRNGGTAPILVLLIAAYSLGAGAPLRRGLATGAFGLAVIATTSTTVANLVFGVVLAVVPWVLGRVVHERRERAIRLERTTAALEREQASLIAEATTEERARIARELHDIVAHSVGVMVLQATAAQKVLDERPDRAREALRSIELTGRQALEELHRLLGILRKTAEQDGLDPQPSLQHLDSLLESLRGSGLPVRSTTEGDVRSLPPGIELAAYRIVQEALTNSLKHGGGAPARLTIRYGTRDLRIEICDDGRVVDGGARSRGGHGLIGMRERVALYGGSVSAGPLDDGGYAVTASLPLDTS